MRGTNITKALKKFIQNNNQYKCLFIRTIYTMLCTFGHSINNILYNVFTISQPQTYVCNVVNLNCLLQIDGSISYKKWRKHKYYWNFNQNTD